VVPADTVMVPGENAMPAIVTVFGELLEVLLLLLLLLEHDRYMMETSKNTLAALESLFFIFGILNYELKTDSVFIVGNAQKLAKVV